MGSVNTVKRKVNRGGWTKRYGRANEGATGSRGGERKEQRTGWEGKSGEKN